MPTKQGGKFRRKNGELTQVSEPAKQQRYGAHAEHPSKVESGKDKAVAAAPVPATAPAAAPSSAKTVTKVKGKDDDAAT